MSRSRYIYTVCWKGEVGPLAAFTVKYESQDWVQAYCEKYGFEIEQFVRYRYAFIFPYSGERMQATLCPFLIINQPPSNPEACPIVDGDPRVTKESWLQ